MTKECRNRATCEICQKRHPTATHRSNQPATQANNSNIKVETVQVNEVASNNNLEQIAANTNNTVTKTYGLCSMVVPILYLATVDNPDEEVLTYALLDSMSDTTFVTNQVVSKLHKATSKLVSLKLTTMTADNLEMMCKVYNNLTIRGLNMHEQIQVGKTYSRDSIPINKQHIPTP